MDALKEKILNSRNLLVVLPENPKPSLLASVFSFTLALEDIGKNIRLVSESSHKICKALKNPKGISEDAKERGDLVVSIDIKNKNLKELKYEKSDDKLHIYINAGKEGLAKDAVLAKFAKSPYDLVLAFGVGSKEELGNFYSKNKDIFDGADIEYIKRDSYFKTIFNFLSSIKTHHTKDIATGLLASAVAETSNFKITKDSNTFKAASFLMDYDAEHQEIISKLYKNIEAGDLKHAGLMLKNSSYLSNSVISKISSLEMKERDLNVKKIINVLQYVKQFMPEKDNFIVLAEALPQKAEKPVIVGVFTSSEKENISRFSQIFNGLAYDDHILFSINAPSLDEAEQKITALINYSF